MYVTKLGRPHKIAGNLSEPPKKPKFCETRKKIKNLPTQKNRIWPIFKPSKI